MNFLVGSGPLGFASKGSKPSKGTAKTAAEGMSKGDRIRINGELKQVPIAFKERKIDYGFGEINAITIPWAPRVQETNINYTMSTRSIKVRGVKFKPSPSERVLTADATCSSSLNNGFDSVRGGWSKLHKTAHLDASGRYPAGGNLNYIDGHVAWQKTSMESRKLVGMVERTHGTPVFYW